MRGLLRFRAYCTETLDPMTGSIGDAGIVARIEGELENGDRCLVSFQRGGMKCPRTTSRFPLCVYEFERKSTTPGDQRRQLREHRQDFKTRNSVRKLLRLTMCESPVPAPVLNSSCTFLSDT